MFCVWTSRSRQLITAALMLTIVGTLGVRGASAQQRPNAPAVVGPVVVEGTLEALYEDDEARGVARLLHFLNTDDNRRIPLRFQDGSIPDLMTGTRVRVRGNNLADGTITTVRTGVSVLGASTSRTLGQQDVLVILFNFSNNVTQPWAPTTITSVNDQVTKYYLENTFGQTTMTFTVTGWYTIAATNSGCDYSTWGSQAETAAKNAGVITTAYDRIVYAFPSASGCNWSGMGNVGGPRSWLNGSYTLRTVAHEQGHNFGDHHSKANQCTTSGCTTVEYGDDRDIMGLPGTIGHMNAYQKERLGWLNYGSSPYAQNVSASGDYWIDAYETTIGNVKALKIPNPVTGGFYYAELRNKMGFDGSLTPGVTLHSALSGISYQVDLDPTTSTFDTTLDVGQTFTDATMGLSVQTIAASTGGATIHVELSGPPCTSRTPTVSMTAAATLKYTVTVKNTNDTTCAASPFSLTAAIPVGWSAAFSPVSIASLAPGASASATLTLTAPTGTAGVFAFTATAIDTSSALTGSANGSVTLVSSLGVTASAFATGSGNIRTATISVSVTAGTAPAAGAAITAIVTGPKGATTTVTGAAASDGTAVLKMSLKARDPSGLYQVQVTATGFGATGTTTTSFTAP